MTEHGLERESRRLRRTAFMACYLAAMVAFVGVRAGWRSAETALLVMVALVVVVVVVVMGLSVRRETSRRAAGEAPSWPAQLPLVAVRQMGVAAPGRHGRVAEVGELFGRLSFVDGGLRWEPRKADRERGVGQVFWDRTWTAEVRRIWGPGGQGCLTLTGVDGTAVDVWIYRRSDFSRTLGLS